MAYFDQHEFYRLGCKFLTSIYNHGNNTFVSLDRFINIVINLGHIRGNNTGQILWISTDFRGATSISKASILT